MKTIKKLSELDRDDLALAGGKGANLGALIRAGLPVPEGFCVTTPAYLRFVEENGLQEKIERLVTRVNPESPQALDEVSDAIRKLFEGGAIPKEIAQEVRVAYRQLRSLDGIEAAVAVRSSATAEDLPDLSFAGQQDTYLNILGEEAVLQAVVRCWGSLWTARAIGYRIRNDIPNEGIALAVVVQRMVQSETSGVLFTANPLTGKRTETVIDATFGLGEALVSGAVEPDHYVVGREADEWKVLSKTLGSKALVIQGKAGGGTKTTLENSSKLQALEDARIIELAQLGKRSEEFFGAPQDMEWGWAEGRLYVLQSRAVTSLFPLPQGVPYEPLEVWFSFASWQGMLEPYSPLGQDVFSNVVIGLGRLFGSKRSAREQEVFREATMRLFVNITYLLKDSLGRQVASIFIEAIDPVSSRVVQSLLADPRLGLTPKKMSWKTKMRIAKGFRPVVLNSIRNIINPARGRALLSKTINRLAVNTREKAAQAKDLKDLLRVMEETAHMAPSVLLPHLLPGVVSGQMPFQVLLRLTEKDGLNPDLAYELMRGLKYNVTTEMDLKLWATTCAIREEAASREHFEARSARELADGYLTGTLPSVAQDVVKQFLDIYGCRALGEIDMYKPRWQDDPSHVMQMIKNYLQIDPVTGSPEICLPQGQGKGGGGQARTDGYLQA